jgi:DNA invertase Pin-like site-specific DNA recombinase
MMPRELSPTVLSRGAVVYVRQSTGGQVQENLESQRRQYALGDLARAYGFQDVRVIDDDLGRSASGTVERPGFRSLVGQVCEGLGRSRVLSRGVASRLRIPDIVNAAIASS